MSYMRAILTPQAGFVGLCTCVRALPQIRRYLYNNHNLSLLKLNKIQIIYRDPQTQEIHRGGTLSVAVDL